MPNSNTDKPRPQDDDESIDLNQGESVEEGASALSFRSTSGSHNSGSGVRSWQQLVRESGREPDTGRVKSDTPAGADEAASDKDLLKEVLAGEPPPSSIIFKDPSQADFVLPEQGRSGPKSGPFELPPDLAATRPVDGQVTPVVRVGSEDNLSIIPHNLPEGSGHSAMTSDLWGGSSSGVDLFRAGSPSNFGDGSPRTEEVSGPPLVRPPQTDSQTFLSEGPGGADESSIDLGSDAAVDLPFGPQSGIGSSVFGRGPAERRPKSGDSDSGLVDLLTPSQEFEVNLPESTTTPSWAAAREDMPATVPLVPAKARLTAWFGGGAAGLLLGVGSMFAFWYFFWQPATGPITAATMADPARADLNAARAEVVKAQDELAALRANMTATQKREAADLKAFNARLAKAQKEADAAKQAAARAAALDQQVKQAEAKRAELAASVERLTNDKAAADARVRDAEATAARLRDETAKAGQEAKAARTALDQAQAAARQAATFAGAVAQRLQAAPNAAATDVLAALDRALAARPTGGEAVASAPPRPAEATAPPQTPQQTQQAAYAGYVALRSGDPAAAEREFARLTASPERNAIHYYFLGLAQWRQGQYHAAEEAFRRGWALERESHPPPSEVEAAFERLGRSEREAVNRYRR